MAPGSLLAARLRQYWEWLLGIHRGCTELSGGYGVAAPPGSVTRGYGDGLQAPGAAARRRCVRRRVWQWGRQGDSMAGVVETAWQPGRSAHGGHVEFQVTEYWSLGGKRGGTGIRTVGVRGGTGEPYSGGAAGKFQMTVYWHRGGIRGGTGDRMVGVRGGTGGPYSGGATGLHGGTGVSP